MKKNTRTATQNVVTESIAEQTGKSLNRMHTDGAYSRPLYPIFVPVTDVKVGDGVQVHRYAKDANGNKTDRIEETQVRIVRFILSQGPKGTRFIAEDMPREPKPVQKVTVAAVAQNVETRFSKIEEAMLLQTQLLTQLLAGKK